MPFFNRGQDKSLFYTDNLPEAPLDNTLTLLFIHGLGASSSYYFPLIPSLTKAGHRCVTLDTYGNGLSKYTGQENTIQSIAADASALLGFLNVTKNVVVVGHSMGGIVASQIAGNDGLEAVVGVILLAPTHPTPAVRDAMQSRISMIEKDGVEAVANTTPNIAIGSKADPVARAFLRELQIKNDPTAYISLCKAIASSPVPDYANIVRPVLVIAGSEDKGFEGARHIAETYGQPKGGKEMKVLDGIGHWVAIENPEACLKHIKDFLKKIVQ
ncbi:hypothetical protein KEM55_007677 [Ascosphaera atra]|nr:hypothetical protein KEM55_007677 [Ascosphaera atra]